MSTSFEEVIGTGVFTEIQKLMTNKNKLFSKPVESTLVWSVVPDDFFFLRHRYTKPMITPIIKTTAPNIPRIKAHVFHFDHLSVEAVVSTGIEMGV